MANEMTAHRLLSQSMSQCIQQSMGQLSLCAHGVTDNSCKWTILTAALLAELLLNVYLSFVLICLLFAIFILLPLNLWMPCFPGLALILWNGLYTVEKIIIQWTLLSEACYFAIQFLGDQTFIMYFCRWMLESPTMIFLSLFYDWVWKNWFPQKRIWDLWVYTALLCSECRVTSWFVAQVYPLSSHTHPRCSDAYLKTFFGPNNFSKTPSSSKSISRDGRETFESWFCGKNSKS